MPYTLEDFFNNKEYTEWDYIESCLSLKKMKIKDLKDLFGVSSTTISKWRKGESISRDKKIYLAKLFGITLDQFYENIESDDQNFFYGLVHKLDPINYKKLRDRDLDVIFESDVKFGWFIEQVLDNDDIDFSVTPDEFDYFCQHLQVSYDYELVDRTIVGQSYLNFDELIEIKKELKQSWGDNIDLNQKFHYKTRDLIEVLLRSEKIKYICKFVSNDVENTKFNKLPVYLNPKEYLEKYSIIKSKVRDFDENCDVLKALIGEGIVFWSNDKPDYKKTFNYLQKVIRNDIYDKYFEEEL